MNRVIMKPRKTHSNKVSHLVVQDVLALIDSNKLTSYLAAAKMLGVSKQRIHQILIENNKLNEVKALVAKNREEKRNLKKP